jgi:hypothetical protein
MSPSDHERDDLVPADCIGCEGRALPDWPENRPGDAGMTWLGEIVSQLEDDPDECWPAMESLGALEEGMCRAIIAELSSYRARAGVRTLLRLLSASPDPGTRSAARLALAEGDAPPVAAALGHLGSDPGSSGLSAPSLPVVRPGVGLQVYPRGESSALEVAGVRIDRGLVTPVDGRGRGTIVVSSGRAGQRRTAAFWCDVQRGILDVVGEVEPDSPSAGRLVEEWIERTGGDCACDAPELAVQLLGGSLLLCGPTIPGPIRDWLDGTLGPAFQPSGLPGIIPAPETSTIPDEEMAARAHEVLDACPSWLDRSALTFELAEEISLREGLSAPDPVRDAGAYRFLFEHLLIHRLEMYRRMLLWMSRTWQGSDRPGLARSAFALACQLSDEQYEVPSHPFTVALSTRSLEAAQLMLRTAEDPRVRDRSSQS